MEAGALSKPFWRRFLWPALLCVFAFAVLMSLGTWQVYRMHWKEALIEDVTARLSADPIALPAANQWTNLKPEEYQYTRVSITGRFQHKQQQKSYMVVSNPKGGRYGGQGHWIMTPFELQSGKLVWVNRGFVPNAFDDSDITTEFQEDVTLTGLMRQPEIATFATPGNSDGFDGNIWFVRNPAAMTAVAKLDGGNVAPFFIDLDADAGVLLPQSGETRVQFENRHFGYVLTWYGIALTLLGVFTAFAVREYKKSRA
ncbi:MAG: SURF1 family protein [Hyphomicrobiales bacterium]